MRVATIDALSIAQNLTIQENKYGKGFRYNIQGWVYIHIEGEPYERGYQYGYLASDEIMDMIQRWANFGHNFNFMKLFIIKNLPKNYDQLSKLWWNICRERAMNKFLKQVPEEYVQEMQGVTDGLKAKGKVLYGRNIEFEDVVASQFVQDVQYTIANIHKGFHSILGFLRGLKHMLSGNILNMDGHCHVFIATGDATSTGEIIVAHATVFSPFISERCNFIIDILPTNGYRFIMTGPPGSLWSQEDWYQNEKGIILTETEIRFQGPFKLRGTIPKGVRSRRAIQYSDNIDEVIKNLKDGNNGLIPNEWIIGDRKTGEIASYLQALYNTPTKRTYNGYYFSNTLPHDIKVLSELTGLPKIILKIYSKIFSKNGDFKIKDDKVIWNQDVYQKLEELGEKYYGSIDTEIAKEIMSTYPITELTTDCKITSSNLMENMGFIAIMGSASGVEWIPTSEIQDKFKGITNLPSSGWVEIYPSNEKPKIYSVKNEKINPIKESKILWTCRIEEDSYKQTSLSSIEISEKYIYVFTDSEKAYYLDKKTGKKERLSSIKEIKSQQIEENNIITTSYNGKTLYGFSIEDDTKLWEFEANEKISSMVVVKEDIVCFGSRDGKVYSLNALNGNKNWDFQTGWGVVTKPAITDDLILFGSLDNNFYAIDKNNGELEWVFLCKSGIQSNPAVYGQYVFFGCDDGIFYALDKNTGSIGWMFIPKYSLKESKINNYITTPIIANPIVDDGIVYINVEDIVYALDAQTTEIFKEPQEKSKPLITIEIIFLLVLIAMMIAILYILSKRRKTKEKNF